MHSGLTRTPKVESSVTSRTGWLWRAVGPCASFEIGVEKPLSDWISCAPFEINFHMDSDLTRTPKVESSVTSRTGWLWRAVGPCASFEIGVEKPLSDWISCAPFEIGVEKPLLHSIFCSFSHALGLNTNTESWEWLNFVCPSWNRSRGTSFTLNFHMHSGLQYCSTNTESWE
jgi:hypothetical protein